MFIPIRCCFCEASDIRETISLLISWSSFPYTRSRAQSLMYTLQPRTFSELTNAVFLPQLITLYVVGLLLSLQSQMDYGKLIP